MRVIKTTKCYDPEGLYEPATRDEIMSGELDDCETAIKNLFCYLYKNYAEEENIKVTLNMTDKISGDILPFEVGYITVYNMIDNSVESYCIEK